MILAEEWMWLQKTQLFFKNVLSTLTDTGMHAVDVAGGSSPSSPTLARRCRNNAEYRVALRVELPVLTLAITDPGEAKAHRPGLGELVRDGGVKQHSALQLHGPVNYSTPFPDTVLRDLVDVASSAMASNVQGSSSCCRSASCSSRPSSGRAARRDQALVTHVRGAT